MRTIVAADRRRRHPSPVGEHARAPPTLGRVTPHPDRHVIVLVVGAGQAGLSVAARLGALGVVGVVSSVVATIWNYLYNLGFDHALRRLRGSVV